MLINSGAANVKQYADVNNMLDMLYAEEAGNNTLDSSEELKFTVDDRAGVAQPPAQAASASVTAAKSNMPTKPTKTGVSTKTILPETKTTVSGDKKTNIKTSGKITKDGTTIIQNTVNVLPPDVKVNTYTESDKNPGPKRRKP